MAGKIRAYAPQIGASRCITWIFAPVAESEQGISGTEAGNPGKPAGNEREFSTSGPLAESQLRYNDNRASTQPAGSGATMAVAWRRRSEKRPRGRVILVEKDLCLGLG
jgi:hypothetical protein